MSSTQKNSILTTQNLCIGYPNKDANIEIATGLNLEINSGELIAVLGKNGSGKSTLIRTLAQMQAALNGKIFLHQKDITTYKREVLSQEISVVLTEKLPDNLLTAYELIVMGRQAHTNWLDTLNAIDKEKIDFAIQATNITSLLDKKFSELSDGQQQKVLIAKALAQDTPIIFLDEPTTHLDVHHRMETFLLLKELAHKYQKSIIMATHEIGLSVQMADELWILEKKSIHTGNSQDLIKNKIISQVFDSDLIQFNAEKASFEYK